MSNRVSFRVYLFIFFLLISLTPGLIILVASKHEAISWLLFAGVAVAFSFGLAGLVARPFRSLVQAVRNADPENGLIKIPKHGRLTPTEARELADALVVLANQQAEAKAVLEERVAERTSELAFSRDLLFKQNVELENLNLAMARRSQENQALLIETLYRSRELAILNEMSGDALAAWGLDDLNQRALNLAAKLLSVPIGLTGLLTERGEKWYCSEAIAPRFKTFAAENPTNQVAALLAYVLQKDCPLVIENLSQSEYPFAALIEATGLQTAMFFPLYSPEDKKSLGVLILGDQKPREWRADEIELMTTVSNQLALSTSHARLLDEIATERNRFNAVLNGVGEGVVLVDEHDRVLFANPAALRNIGLNKTYSIGQYDTASLLLVAAERSRELAAQLAESETVEPVQVERAGRTWSVSINPIYDNSGEFIGVAQVQRDVTEAARVDRMKTEFISLVSHELRTPLTSIKGYLELVLDGDTGPINEVQQRFLEIARNGSDRLMALINDLLDVSRIESGKVELERTVLYMTGAINNVIEPLRLVAQEKQLEIQVKVTPDLPPAWADRDRVTQILTNLLSNALKYNRPGGLVEVNVRVGDERHFLEIEVRDTGLGMTEDEQKQLFNKFFRSSSPTIRSISGTGLGLAITKALVEMHGGQIWVQSVLKQGSTFGFSLPIAVVPQVQTPFPFTEESLLSRKAANSQSNTSEV